ncbi:MAG: hypothetical protein K0M47_10785, partial [Rhizobium sp.]|nr:hypothetical protein [Rhizobium sp.]
VSCEFFYFLAEFDIGDGRFFVHGLIVRSGSVISVYLVGFLCVVFAPSKTRLKDHTPPAQCGLTTASAYAA